MTISTWELDVGGREPIAAPVEGYREWNLVARDDTWLLVGIGVPLPWVPDERGACGAACAAGGLHAAPTATCRCGFHLLVGPPPDCGGIVRGRAAGWGALVEHEEGWRCRWARPVHLRVSRDRLAGTMPSVSPEDVAARLAATYGCEVELVGEPVEASTVVALPPSSILPLLMVAAVPGLLVQGGALAAAGLACLAAGLGALVLTMLRVRDRADRPTPGDGVPPRPAAVFRGAAPREVRGRADAPDDEEDRMTEIDRLYEQIDEIEIAMMTTVRADGHLEARPMATQRRMPGADLWFVTTDGTSAADDLRRDPNLNLSYYKDRTREWVSVSGRATLSDDRQTIRELYAPDWKIWLSDEGDPRHGTPDDPRLVVIGVEIHGASFLEIDKPQPVVLYEMVKGFLTRSTPEIGETHTVTGRSR